MANQNESPKVNNYPYFSPRFWHGMSTSVWHGLVREHQYDIQGRYPMVGWIALCGLANSALNRLQKRRFRQQARTTPLVDDPVFVIGHWRTGTTYLHSLLAQDPNLWAPTCRECATPRHFLVSETLVKTVMGTPNKRPMDNVSITWDEPQEDEIALCVAGAPSLYRNIAFPRHEAASLDALTLEGLSQEELAHWKSSLREFVGYLNVSRKKQLVLKSPTHTARIRTLLEMYPRAKFIHITRHPHKFIPSTIHLWNALNQTTALQKDLTAVDMEDYVFDCYDRMYESYDRSYKHIPAENFVELTFQELVTNPVGAVESIYERLGMAGFSEARAPIADYANARRNYKKNKLPVSERLADRIDQHCKSYIQKYCPLEAPRKAA